MKQTHPYGWIALFLAVALFFAGMPVTAQAEEDGANSNITIGIITLVLVVFGIVAWQNDFGDDDMMASKVAQDDQLVLCTPATDASDWSAGLGWRADF